MVKKIEDAGGKVEAVYYGSSLPLSSLFFLSLFLLADFGLSLSFLPFFVSTLSTEGEGHGTSRPFFPSTLALIPSPFPFVLSLLDLSLAD